MSHLSHLVLLWSCFLTDVLVLLSLGIQASMTQLLLYYTRLLELVKKQGPDGNALIRDAVNVPSIMYEIKRNTRS